MKGELLTDHLRPAELDILRRLAKGSTSKEIADLRGVHVNTIQNQMKDARHTLGARTTLQAVVIALTAGLIE